MSPPLSPLCRGAHADEEEERSLSTFEFYRPLLLQLKGRGCGGCRTQCAKFLRYTD
jgi:hypothetical protein